MADYPTIYREHADRYDELVGAEDYEGNLRRTIEQAVRLDGARVVEAGAGTGRITRLLLEAGVTHVLATELEPAMLERAKAALGHYGDRIGFAVADARALPAENGRADLAIAGWVFGHFRKWMPDDWKTEVGKAVDELERVLRPGGCAMVIETLGTGSTEPAPRPGLAEYYEWLEAERGFVRREIRTDYRFASVDDAARVTGFFFGEDFAARVRAERWAVVPECTGVWTRAR